MPDAERLGPSLATFRAAAEHPTNPDADAPSASTWTVAMNPVPMTAAPMTATISSPPFTHWPMRKRLDILADNVAGRTPALSLALKGLPDPLRPLLTHHPSLSCQEQRGDSILASGGPRRVVSAVARACPPASSGTRPWVRLSERLGSQAISTPPLLRHAMTFVRLVVVVLWFLTWLNYSGRGRQVASPAGRAMSNAMDAAGDLTVEEA